MERVGWGLDSEAEYDRFLNDEARLGNLFDIWSDPNADDAEQDRAYGEFWELLEAYGLDRDSFDWHSFREKYGSAA